MPTLISSPVRIPAAGTLPKLIDEYLGGASTGHQAVSVAHMRSPSGWREPGQQPDFSEITVVLKGEVVVDTRGPGGEETSLTVRAGQAVLCSPGEWVRYSTPHPDGAEYIAVCFPAFSPHTVHRDPG
jgi:hypothetical protein